VALNIYGLSPVAIPITSRVIETLFAVDGTSGDTGDEYAADKFPQIIRVKYIDNADGK
jgi:hypothetical protein